MRLRKTLTLLSAILMSIALLTTSCNDYDYDKDGGNDQGGVTPQKPDFAKKAVMSVSGFVTDENNNPLRNVKIQAGDSVVSTNQYGHFIVANVNLVENHSFIVAEKDGYFRGTRTWMGQKDGDYEVRIKLLPKTVAGEFAANRGGDVTSKQGVKLTFPANAVVAVDGSAYTGSVNVAIQWLDAVSNDFGETMPGDLSAIDAAGNVVGLISFGMSAIELRGDNNQLLQVASGKKVNIVVPIAAELQASAKETIPLWHFDETKGTWIEEGVAKKEGNTFVGEISHFSWWNWDYPNPTVTVTARIADLENNPIQHGQLKYTFDSYIGGYPISDSNGIVQFRMLENSSGSLYTYQIDNNFCEEHLKDFTVAEEDINLGSITINTNYTILEGNIELLCNGNQEKMNGHIYLKSKGKQYHSEITDNKFKFMLFSCNKYTETAQLTGSYTITDKAELGSFDFSKEITLNHKEKNTETIVEECKETKTSISGVTKTCRNETYSDGYVVLSYGTKSHRADLVSGSFKINVDIEQSVSGNLSFYDNNNALRQVYNLKLNPGDNLTYNHVFGEKLHITGSAFGCDNTSITNGCLTIESENLNQTVPIVDGIYTLEPNIYICDNEKVKITVTDFDNLLEISQNITLVPGNNIIPNISTCGGVTTPYNYFKYEMDGVKYSFQPDKVFSYLIQSYDYEYENENTTISGAGARIYESYQRIYLDWFNSKKPTIGTFNINSGYVQIQEGESIRGYYIIGKVTITETTTDTEIGHKLIMKGTFEGIAKGDFNVPTENTKPIKGEFFFYGPNIYQPA